MVGHAYQKAYSGQKGARSTWWDSTPLFRQVFYTMFWSQQQAVQVFHRLRVPYVFSHTGWTSCCKPGWRTGCQHANRQGHHAPSAAGRCRGLPAEWGEIKTWRVYSTDARLIMAMTLAFSLKSSNVCEQATGPVRPLNKCCETDFFGEQFFFK